MLLLSRVGGLWGPGSPEAGGLAEVVEGQADCLRLEAEHAERVSAPDGRLCWSAPGCCASRHLEEKKKKKRGF